MISIILIFLLFQNIFFNLFNAPSFFEYWDEVFTLIVIFLSFFRIKEMNNTINKKYFNYFITLFLLIFIGLLGNIVFGYAESYNAIFRDIIGFIKFPLIYALLKMTNYDVYIVKKIKPYTIKIIKISIFIIFTCGIISIFRDIGLSQNTYRYGIKPFQFLYSHPTYLVTSFVWILLLIELFDTKRHKKLFEVMCFIVIFLALRTKGIVFLATFVFLKYSKSIIKNRKILTIFILSTIIIITGYNKFATYASYSTSAREVLYTGSVELTKKCFPLGSGFATYASHLSGKYNSKVYDFIKIPFNAYEGATVYVLGDTGYPYYIGQFGFIGIILFIFLIRFLLKIVQQDDLNVICSYGILVYILICLTSEATLIGNGFEMAFFLSIFSINQNLIREK